MPPHLTIHQLLATTAHNISHHLSNPRHHISHSLLFLVPPPTYIPQKCMKFTTLHKQSQRFTFTQLSSIAKLDHLLRIAVLIALNCPPKHKQWNTSPYPPRKSPRYICPPLLSFSSIPSSPTIPNIFILYIICKP